FAKAATGELAGASRPIALTCLGQSGQRAHDQGFVEAVAPELGANPQRAIAGTRAPACNAGSEAGVVLPAFGGHALDRGLRLFPADATSRQLVRQLLARMFAAHEKPQRTLRRGWLGPASLARPPFGGCVGCRRTLAFHGRHG